MSNNLAFDSSLSSGEKIFTNYLHLRFARRWTHGQKETVIKEVQILW